MGHPDRERCRLQGNRGELATFESLTLCFAYPVTNSQTRYAFGQAPWLCWERVTRVPIQASLVDFTLLSKEEAQWLKDHNDLCIKEVMPLLNRTGDEKARKWLKKQAL
jgi:Xaa-Pro aminopeptidase